MIRLTLDSLDLQNPTWSSPTLKPGVEVTMSVDAPSIAEPQFVRFDILCGAELIDSVTGRPGKTSAKWTPPNLFGSSNLTFRASLMDKPTPANGHTAAVSFVTSPALNLRSYSVASNSIDAAFVPKQEKLEVGYTVTDPDGAALKGRFEVWGERCPDEKPVPIYTEDFTPAAGAQTWTSWAGKANGGKLSGKYITPEFSPYRVRIIIGPDAASVKDPDGAGQGKVAMVEKQFEISVFSVFMEVQKGVKDKETAKLKEHKLKNVLVIQPPGNDGKYDDDDMGRLPKASANEVCRVRIPMTRHWTRAENLGQGGNNIGDGYGSTKISIDATHYTRPELPIEFEPRLKSRDNTVNNDVDKKGLFEKEAVGPLKIEPIAEDPYDARFPLGALGVQYGTPGYLTYAAFKVKDGQPSGPLNTGPAGNPANRPIYHCWQARLEVAADNNGTPENFTITNFNATANCGYSAGADELTVYLNRARLERSDTGDDTELLDGKKDYREVPAGGGALSTQIRLAPHLTKAQDVLWVVRKSAGANANVLWNEFPQGPNCHKYYGGARGIKPTADLNNYFRKAYSADPAAAFDPIIGKASGSYRYTDYINLRPAILADQDKQERVEISTRTSGSRQGYAGVLFSPSYVCGDTYVLNAVVEHQPYERNFGFVTPKAKLEDSKTGSIVIWRHVQVKKSLKGPGIADAGAPHPADGVNTQFSGGTGANAYYADAFHEWTTGDAPVHSVANLKKYRKAHNLFSNGMAGKVPLRSNADVKNELAQYDYYREQLPPGIPANRVNVASNEVENHPPGTLSATVGAGVLNALGAHVGPADAALNAGVAALPIYGGTADDYYDLADGIATDLAIAVMDALIPRDTEPRKVSILRWHSLSDNRLWKKVKDANLATRSIKVNTTVWQGMYMGDGQTLLYASTVAPSLFSHEMGHSAHLAHFVAEDVNWKHHHLGSPDCLMSYNYTKGNIWRPGAAVGPENPAGTAMPATPYPLVFGVSNVEEGWPHRGRFPNPPANPWTGCIQYGPGIAPGQFCAKCLLKLRGWDEEKLPVSWTHPDLF